MPGRSFSKIIQLGLLILATTIAATSYAKPPTYTCPDSAEKFWNEFRQAAINSDLPALTRMTQFPLPIYGTLGDNPIKTINQNDFKKILPELMTTDPGMSEKPSSMKIYIQDIETLPPMACNESGEQIRVGSWLFILKDNKWSLTRAYLEE